MIIVAHISHEGTPVADATYRAGLHVEVRVALDFQRQQICFELCHSANCELKGSWEEALDNYFNEGTFDSKESMFPGEMRRIGSAREHKALFRQAAHALLKDLQPHGYFVEVKYM
ncbi:hypothetical protein [Desulfomonile tiedjei]|uniref:Uncharacterized protein n=1 Tax=Desulfomonile tiedjei (strain ATCC 49306 / DSM 6799 / DCB-1) TaxID=706587 RepID=I4C152_DESTA|nr:hypothetical protein [Desulfomonile tiedjei]AFM23293.1 hypothetical protein Desti_0561 [Desulfomonile tiedjei DSM 6799]